MFIQKVLFTKEECNQIINQMEEISDAKIIRGSDEKIDKSFRSSKISNFISDKVKDIILAKVSSLDTTITSLPELVNIVSYTKGDFFSRHQDSYGKVTQKRKKTLIIQLSDETYKGGILKVWPNESDIPHIVSTEVGNAVIFDSNYFHELEPMLEGHRYAMVCWFQKNNLTNSYTI